MLRQRFAITKYIHLRQQRVRVKHRFVSHLEVQIDIIEWKIGRIRNATRILSIDTEVFSIDECSIC